MVQTLFKKTLRLAYGEWENGSGVVLHVDFKIVVHEIFGQQRFISVVPIWKGARLSQVANVF
jgi:hypothetical protein